MIPQPITVHCAISIVLISAGYTGPSIAYGDGGESGYVSLFNGKNLDGWIIENNAQFSVRDGLLAGQRLSGAVHGHH